MTTIQETPLQPRAKEASMFCSTFPPTSVPVRRINVGCLVVVEGMKGFQDDRMGGRVLSRFGGRDALPGHVWVKEIWTGGGDHPPGWEAFVWEAKEEQVRLAV